MKQPSLFVSGRFGPEEKPQFDDTVRLRVLITVKAAPQPSEKYGETVCVAGISIDPQRPGWIRLYPINFRELGDAATFKKYDVISVDAKPARRDQRRESWNPFMGSMKNEGNLKSWRQRREWVDEYVEDSMCRIYQATRERPDAQSLALIRVKDIGRLKIAPHPGWGKEEQRKIDAYVRQLGLFGKPDLRPCSLPGFKEPITIVATIVGAEDINRGC